MANSKSRCSSSWRPGHFQEYIEHYIKSQEMIEEHENEKVVPDLDEGEQAQREPLPDPR